MNYLELINNWHRKASDETNDYFSKYVFEYLAFIAALVTQFYSGRNIQNDRQALQLLKRDSDLKQEYFDKISQIPGLKDVWEEIKIRLDDIPLGQVTLGDNDAEEIKWWNCSHSHCNQKTDEEEEMQTGILRDLTDWENMIEFWVSIRNNLFHCTKNPESNRDQFVVESGYKTIKEVVPILLNTLPSAFTE